MKATRHTGAVVCFNVPKEKYSTLEKICRKLGLKIREVDKADYSKCIAEQFMIQLPQGLGEPKEGKNYDFDEEMIILHIPEESHLNRFLQESRQKNASVDYKAVMTPTNCTWQPKALVDQLAQEHEYMKQQAAASKQAVKDAAAGADSDEPEE